MNIYFAGIGGVGIGPLAQIARDAGNSVQGSDLNESLTTRRLSEQGIPVDTNQDGTFLRACHSSSPIDWFVYSASLPEDHPELVTARSLGIKASKRDELLAHIIKEKNLKLIAVAGTHGKTTTTGMAVWAFKELGIPVSYSVGSTLSFGPSGAFDPKSEYFIYECDEFDRNFLHFFPHVALITSIGYDHPDVYSSEKEYMAAFRQFLDQSEHTIMWQHDGDAIRATEKDGWILREEEVQTVKLAGEHNRRNATLVIKGLEYLKLTDTATAQQILARFPGTDRRFEKLADNLYSDYGHHPSEIAATLQMARELSKHVVLIYQPHQNVRQHEIIDQYVHCFELSEAIYWLPTYLSREDPTLPILTPEQLAVNVTNRHAIHFVELDDQLWHSIQTAQHNGKLVLLMGAGSIDGWARKKLAESSTSYQKIS